MFNPSACQNVMVFKPKITGINQFHNHMVGRANSTAITNNNKSPNITSPIIFATVSICQLIKF